MTENKKDVVEFENYHKCVVNEGFCPTLEMFTQHQGRAKGMTFFNVIDMNTKQAEIRTIGVVYRRNPKDKGIMLNYCPFCGEDLRPFYKELKE